MESLFLYKPEKLAHRHTYVIGTSGIVRIDFEMFYLEYYLPTSTYAVQIKNGHMNQIQTGSNDYVTSLIRYGELVQLFKQDFTKVFREVSNSNNYYLFWLSKGLIKLNASLFKLGYFSVESSLFKEFERDVRGSVYTELEPNTEAYSNAVINLKTALDIMRLP